jgi:hypothetical protein
VNDSIFVKGILEMLREAYEGGRPGEGTGFVEVTKKDGTGNGGLFATLDALSAEHASLPTALGLSVAAHAAHAAFHMEATVRWLNGDRGPNDWPGSFEPRAVDEAGWAATRTRLRASYDALAAYAKGLPSWNEDVAGAIAGSVAHAAYHLGAIRQVAKLAR